MSLSPFLARRRSRVLANVGKADHRTHLLPSCRRLEPLLNLGDASSVEEIKTPGSRWWFGLRSLESLATDSQPFDMKPMLDLIVLLTSSDGSVFSCQGHYLSWNSTSRFSENLKILERMGGSVEKTNGRAK